MNWTSGKGIHNFMLPEFIILRCRKHFATETHPSKILPTLHAPILTVAVWFRPTFTHLSNGFRILLRLVRRIDRGKLFPVVSEYCLKDILIPFRCSWYTHIGTIAVRHQEGKKNARVPWKNGTSFLYNQDNWSAPVRRPDLWWAPHPGCSESRWLDPPCHARETS